ncbi:MAG: hypothetical protein FVQ83_07645 [Chloroflexi bacterium]|nr:hypothetical protein [Chloroflexota bacterium]
MKTKAIFLIWILGGALGSVLVGCGSQPTDDLPLEEFIIGRWRISETLTEDRAEPLFYALTIEFYNSDRMSLSEGSLFDGYFTRQFDYEFVEQNSIGVRSIRSYQKWDIERDGEYLSVEFGSGFNVEIPRRNLLILERTIAINWSIVTIIQSLVIITIFSRLYKKHQKDKTIDLQQNSEAIVSSDHNVEDYSVYFILYVISSLFLGLFIGVKFVPLFPFSPLGLIREPFEGIIILEYSILLPIVVFSLIQAPKRIKSKFWLSGQWFEPKHFFAIFTLGVSIIGILMNVSQIAYYFIYGK